MSPVSFLACLEVRSVVLPRPLSRTGLPNFRPFDFRLETLPSNYWPVSFDDSGSVSVTQTNDPTDMGSNNKSALALTFDARAVDNLSAVITSNKSKMDTGLWRLRGIELLLVPELPVLTVVTVFVPDNVDVVIAHPESIEEKAWDVCEPIQNMLPALFRLLRALPDAFWSEEFVPASLADIAHDPYTYQFTNVLYVAGSEEATGRVVDALRLPPLRQVSPPIVVGANKQVVSTTMDVSVFDRDPSMRQMIDGALAMSLPLHILNFSTYACTTCAAILKFDTEAKGVASPLANDIRRAAYAIFSRWQTLWAQHMQQSEAQRSYLRTVGELCGLDQLVAQMQFLIGLVLSKAEGEEAKEAQRIDRGVQFAASAIAVIAAAPAIMEGWSFLFATRAAPYDPFPRLWLIRMLSVVGALLIIYFHRQLRGSRNRSRTSKVRWG